MNNNDLGVTPSGPGLSPTVEPVPVSPADAASIPNAVDWAALSAGAPACPTAKKPIEVTVVGRRCVYVNHYRIAGGKPYFSENLPSHDLNTTLGEVLAAFSDNDIRKALREKKAKVKYYADFHAARAASAMSARSAETEGLSPKDASAVAKPDAQPPAHSDTQPSGLLGSV